MSVGALPLVGRETELGVLERALEAVAAGQSWVVGLVGEPGIGKSRLLGELSDRSAERGDLVFAGRASELERDVPFALWVEALGAHVHGAGEALLGLEEGQLADLAVAVPAVARVSGVPRCRRARVGRARGARAARDHTPAFGSNCSCRCPCRQPFGSSDAGMADSGPARVCLGT